MFIILRAQTGWNLQAVLWKVFLLTEKILYGQTHLLKSVMGYMLKAVERDCYSSPKHISQTQGGKRKGIKPEPDKPGELPEAAKRQLDRALSEPLHFQPEGPNAFPKAEIPMENGGPKQTLTVAMLDKMSGKKEPAEQRPFFDKEDEHERKT